MPVGVFKELSRRRSILKQRRKEREAFEQEKNLAKGIGGGMFLFWEALEVGWLGEKLEN